jgi:hypothetical protein
MHETSKEVPQRCRHVTQRGSAADIRAVQTSDGQTYALHSATATLPVHALHSCSI